MVLTPDALVALVRQLRGLGVTRLKAGDVEVDIERPIAAPTKPEREPDIDDEDVLFHSADDRMPAVVEDDE